MNTGKKDLSRYRLNSISELDSISAKIDQGKFLKYKESVYNMLLNLREGECFDIVLKIRAENQEIFIKCVCCYMIEMRGDCNIIFSDDFSMIKGVVPFNTYKRK